LALQVLLQRQGKTPPVRGAIQKADRAARSATIEALATEWLEIQRNKLTPKTFDNKRERFAAFVFPYLGSVRWWRSKR